MVLFLNLNEPCTAMPVEEQRIGRQEFQQLRFDCGAKQFRIWSRFCRFANGATHDGYWGRPFFLEEVNSQQGLYLNRFGELHTGWHVHLDETYVPHCGA